MKIALLGFGTVAKGAYEEARIAGGIDVVRILARHSYEGYEDLSGIMTADIEDIVSDPDIELVVEAIGGVEPAREYVTKCLRAGKHVVTPNKNLISACYTELMDEAEKNGVKLRFTSAVGGGIPWLYNLMRTKRADNIIAVRGIVNGTCNYILDAMYRRHMSYDEVLKDAQEKGYAEADPSADVEGWDTLRKAVISANLAFDASVRESEVPCYGIDTIKDRDIEWFRSKGLACRLMMKAQKTETGVEIYVEPTAFRAHTLEANVKENNNLITLTAEHIRTQSFYGQGAGMYPTGQSVIQDVLDIRDGKDQDLKPAGSKILCADNDNAVHRYYIRHDRMCEHMEPLIETYTENNGIFYCISKPLGVDEMHEMGHHRKEKGREMFFAALEE